MATSHQNNRPASEQGQADAFEMHRPCAALNSVSNPPKCNRLTFNCFQERNTPSKGLNQGWLSSQWQSCRRCRRRRRPVASVLDTVVNSVANSGGEQWGNSGVNGGVNRPLNNILWRVMEKVAVKTTTEVFRIAAAGVVLWCSCCYKSVV